LLLLFVAVCCLFVVVCCCLLLFLFFLSFFKKIINTCIQQHHEGMQRPVREAKKVFQCLCGSCDRLVSKATYYRHLSLQQRTLAEQKNVEPDIADIARFAEIDSDKDSVRSELENLDMDQIEALEENIANCAHEDLEESTSTDDEDNMLNEPVPINHKPVSDFIREGSSVAQVSFALVELQRRFKLSKAAMDSVAGLLQVTTGQGSCAPSFFSACAMADKADLDYRTVDVCVNDCCVFENAPHSCDPTGERQNGARSICPGCHESRYVLLGPDKGKPRKQIIVFSLLQTIKMLFAQPGFSQKLNERHGQPHSDIPAEDYEMQVNN
jgi:hypothetical protein